MGNTSSNNRKITVVNDDVAGVIRISDSVVRRLKGELDDGREKSRQPPTSNNDTPTPQKPNNMPPAINSSATIGQTKGPKDQYPYSSVMEDAHLTALKIRQEKEAEIRRVEEHWRAQLLNLTNHYNQLAQLTEQEYRAAVEDVERSFAKDSFSNVCREQQDRVLKCYQENKDRPLHCAAEVKQFAACVQQFREEQLLNKPLR